MQGRAWEEGKGKGRLLAQCRSDTGERMKGREPSAVRSKKAWARSMGSLHLPLEESLIPQQWACKGLSASLLCFIVDRLQPGGSVASVQTPWRTQSRVCETLGLRAASSLEGAPSAHFPGHHTASLFGAHNPSSRHFIISGQQKGKWGLNKIPQNTWPLSGQV